MPEKEMPGDTVQERDAREIAEVIAIIDEHKRVRAGLPPKPIFRDVDVIPPVTGVANTALVSEEIGQDTDPEKIIPFHLHVRWARDELYVAQNLDDPQSKREIKKKAA